MPVNDYVELLRKLIEIPSLSSEEQHTADYLEQWLQSRGATVQRYNNNVVALRKSASDTSETILLNSHHDTIRPQDGWDTDPYKAVDIDGKIYGVGSNDAGAALVTMCAAFEHLLQFSDLNANVVLALTAEEETSGANGMQLLSTKVFGKTIPMPTLALVGEPTQMNMAIAERGLMVLDCCARGISGHAARNEGINAIYKALGDISWFETAKYPVVSQQLGEVKMTVTVISAGKQHNVVPDTCEFVVDVRTTDVASNEEVLEFIRNNVECEVTPRSMRLQPSSLAPSHPIVQIGLEMGFTAYGSPTLSDQSLLPPGVPSMKIGPGDSARSHTPNEYIAIDEIVSGITTLNTLLERYLR